VTIEMCTEGANEGQQHNEVHEPDWVGTLLIYSLHKEAYLPLREGLTHAEYERLYSKQHLKVSRSHCPPKVHSLS